MAARRDWNHKARKGDHARVFGFKAEPEFFRGANGQWSVAGELVEGGRIIITDRTSRKRPTRRKRRQTRK